MIEWRDEGIVLSARPHGETSAIVDVFTRTHGRHAGIVRGGAGRRMAPVLLSGAQVAVVWRARLEDHLGGFGIEPLRNRGAALGVRLTAAGLAAVAGLLSAALPDRDPHPDLHDRSAALLDLAASPAVWPLAYLQWELALLEALGFGLDLSACAVSGTRDGLAHVSPRSGRAVSAAAAGVWADRLLPLPPVMLGQGDATGRDIALALGTTGWFVEHRLLAATGRRMPAARARLVAEIARQS